MIGLTPNRPIITVIPGRKPWERVVLEARNVSYGEKFKDISFQLFEGENFGIWFDDLGCTSGQGSFGMKDSGQVILPDKCCD